MLKGLRKLFSKRATGGGDAAGPGSPSDKEPAPAVHRGPSIVHRPIPSTDLDADAVKIVQRLTRFDHKAYLVGGCVRDLLLERAPKDFDVATSATPRQIKRLFRNCRIIGRRFRLAHIYYHTGKIIEVATFRSSDGTATGEGRDDLLITEDNVFGTPEQDALRRDFTINSLFYDVNDETVLDHAKGLDDLKGRFVRTIGDPEIRFREDPIRSLRAIKFAARLDFRIERKTLAALERTKTEIHKAAPPRVLEELNRFCRGAAARRSFELLKETGLFEIVLPEIVTGYSTEQSWSILFDLLGRMDRDRFPSKHEIRTGEIFAALLFPILANELGWLGEQAPGESPRVMDVRARIDDLLRPVALRLRVPRREQEYCRQILGTLFRLVPVRRIRRNTKRSILARPSLPESLWMLETFAGPRGGVFAESLEFWRDAPAPSPQEAEQAAEEQAAEEQAAPTGRKRRRRGGRGGRGRRRSSRDSGAERTEAETVKAKPPEGEPRSKDQPRRVARWNDDYFFEALPSVPDLKLDGGHERYRSSTDSETTNGAATDGPVGQAASPTSDSPAPADARTEPGAPPKRRRRRRRRRRSGGSQTPASDSEGNGEPAGARES